MLLNDNELLNSYNAIRSFLPSPKLEYRSFINVEIIVSSDLGRHPMNDTIELVYSGDAEYTIYSSCFFRYTKTSKLKSSDYLFKWDEANKWIYTIHVGQKIVIKFVSYDVERD